MSAAKNPGRVLSLQARVAIAIDVLEDIVDADRFTYGAGHTARSQFFSESAEELRRMWKIEKEDKK